MRIGLVVENFDPLCGGLEQWAVRHATQLVTRGHEVHVAAAVFDRSVDSLPIIRHGLTRGGGRLGFARNAEAVMRRLALDVVHDTGAGWYCDVFQPHYGSRLAVIEQKIRSAPAWVRPAKRAIVAVAPRYRRFAELTRRQYTDDGRILLALSRRVADDFRRLHGVADERIRLIYNGVDTERFSPDNRRQWRDETRSRLKVDDGTTLLLIVAHNFRLKGVPTLLRAMQRLAASERRVHLAVVGGKRRSRRGGMARRSGVAGSVTFVGPVSDTRPYYAAADLYVQPTQYDACSLVVLEALAAGLPVITSRCNGAAELMREGVQGRLLDDPRDDRRLAEQIDQLLDPALRLRLGRAARNLALGNTLAQSCDRIESVYRQIVEARHGRPHPQPRPRGRMIGV